MTTLDHGRRVAVLVVVVLGLLLVPSVATARFTASRTPQLVVGTDRMETPAAVTGSYRCALPFFTEGIEVTVTGFADSGPAGAGYDYTVTGRNTSRSASSAARSISLSSASVGNDLSATQWTITIRSRLGSWTGSPYIRTITCPGFASDTGQL